MSAQLKPGRCRILVWQTDSNRSRWVQTNLLIKQWLTERQALLVSYNELCQEVSGTVNDLQLQTFCQLLIDYVSMGHFKIFEKLAETQANFSVDHSELEKNLLSKIYQSTMFVLNFNDTYENYQSNSSTNPQALRLSDDLSELGEMLAHRMDWEDELIRNYLKITKGNRKEISKTELSETHKKIVPPESHQHPQPIIRTKDKISKLGMTDITDMHAENTETSNPKKPQKPRHR